MTLHRKLSKYSSRLTSCLKRKPELHTYICKIYVGEETSVFSTELCELHDMLNDNFTLIKLRKFKISSAGIYFRPVHI